MVGDCKKICNEENIEEPCFYDPECIHGGLGCNALGITYCRFCEFDHFSHIKCKN